ncbi:MAG: DUF2141 domain-containing protein [Cyanobacteria bacterium P01_D01_bin.105]
MLCFFIGLVKEYMASSIAFSAVRLPDIFRCHEVAMNKKFSLFSVVTVAVASTVAAVLLPASAAQAQRARSGQLTAAVSGLRNQTGQVCFSLFDGAQGFPNDPASIVETQCVSAELATLTADEPLTDPVDEQVEAESPDAAEMSAVKSVTFESLPLGTYAVSVFHDENEDGEINQGNFGIPLEGFGFSKNPTITTRVPEFSETAIIVVGANTITEIELIYY